MNPNLFRHRGHRGTEDTEKGRIQMVKFSVLSVSL